jgi:hypothetical protein
MQTLHFVVPRDQLTIALCRHMASISLSTS